MSGQPIVWLNGGFVPLAEACVPVLDRGFLLGDGVYEVIPAYGGRLFRLEAHLRRLEHSLEATRIPFPFTPREWRELLEELIGRNGGSDLSIYLQVTRGAAAHRDHAFPEGVEPTVFAMATPIKPLPRRWLEEGISAVVLDDIRWERCDIKSISLLANVLLRQQALDADAQEAILVRDGQATEGAASNLFVVIDATVITPPKGHLLLPGITRDLVLELAEEGGMAVAERPIEARELATADEIWVTSSTRRVLAVTRLDGRPVGEGRPGPLWTRIHAAYAAHVGRLRTEEPS